MSQDGMGTHGTGIGWSQRESPNLRLQWTVTFHLHGTYNNHIHTMSGVIASPAGQTGIGSSGALRPAPHLLKNLKFKKKILTEVSSNAAPSFSSSTPTMPTTSCKAESSSAGPSHRLHWTLEPELIQPASFLRQLGDASCINGDRLTKIYTRSKELCHGMYRASEIHYKPVIDTFCPS